MSSIEFDLKELTPRDYSRFFLAENPFPAVSVAEEDPKVFVGVSIGQYLSCK